MQKQVSILENNFYETAQSFSGVAHQIAKTPVGVHGWNFKHFHCTAKLLCYGNTSTLGILGNWHIV